jgi:hypothetical protein
VPRISGLAVTATAMVQQSAVTDPITGAKRSISERERVRINGGVRHSVSSSRFAWGADYTYQSARHTFRVKEVDGQRKSPSLDVFLEAACPGVSHCAFRLCRYLPARNSGSERFSNKIGRIHTPDSSVPGANQGIGGLQRCRDRSEKSARDRSNYR